MNSVEWGLLAWAGVIGATAVGAKAFKRFASKGTKAKIRNAWAAGKLARGSGRSPSCVKREVVGKPCHCGHQDCGGVP